MNLKPYRDIDEHDVLNGTFSTVEGTVSKGSFLQIVSFDPDNNSGFTNALAINNGINTGGIGTWAASYEVIGKVRLAQSATGVLGLALADVYPVGSNPFIVTIADQRRYFDKIPSGQAIPILKRGLVELNGFSGTPYAGAAGVIIAGTPGTIGVAAAGTTPSVGMFLSQSGADGYAIFNVNCL